MKVKYRNSLLRRCKCSSSVRAQEAGEGVGVGSALRRGFEIAPKLDFCFLNPGLEVELGRTQPVVPLGGGCGEANVEQHLRATAPCSGLGPCDVQSEGGHHCYSHFSGEEMEPQEAKRLAQGSRSRKWRAARRGVRGGAQRGWSESGSGEQRTGWKSDGDIWGPECHRRARLVRWGEAHCRCERGPDADVPGGLLG